MIDSLGIGGGRSRSLSSSTNIFRFLGNGLKSNILIISLDTAGSSKGALGFKRLNTKVQT